MILINRYKLACYFSILSFFAHAQNFDIDLVRSINHNQSTFKDNLFKTASNSVIVVNIVAPASIFAAGLINHDKHLQKAALYTFGGFVASAIVVQGMKRIVKRDRPFITYADILEKSNGDGYSFPSGHTAAAFSTATSLSLLFPKWYVIVPSYLYASTVAYARMYQGVHYPTDVFAGAVLGAGSAWLSDKASKWLTKRSVDKNQQIPVVPY